MGSQFAVLQGHGSWTVSVSITEDMLETQTLGPHRSPTRAESLGRERRNRAF